MTNAFHLEGSEWRAVKVGPEVVGWAAPYKASTSRKIIRADITVLMGDGRFDLNVDKLPARLMGPSHNWDGHYITEELIYFLYYGQSFRLRVPDDSLSVSGAGEIVYSQRTRETLNIGLSKLFNAFRFMVQSDLHALTTPTDVVRKYAELDAYGYPKSFLRQMTWRGKPLCLLPQESQMLVRVVKDGLTTATPGGDRYLHVGLGKLRTLMNSTPFSSFVEWQVRPHYGGYRTQPKNVFFIRASTSEEYETALTIFQSPTLLKKYSVGAGHPDIPDATFFLARAGDPLEDWVDGEVVGVGEMTNLLSS